MAADGSIIIDTRINTDGFKSSSTDLKSQFSKLGSAVKKLGTAIVSAFAVRQVVQFAKESVEASMQLSNALQGLRSILEGQGRSFSDAQKFVEEYTSDGLIPATNAITAYKNLAARGYDDSQIRQVMVALKDASAFGRQASYTMGEAVQSATEGLKNENSILVDNAGVTKNVAKMWEDYAKSIGTTSAKLTQQQKIQAEVNGILEESKYQVGDAEKVASTLSGQLSQLSFHFKQLKVAVGDTIAPLVEAVLPAINVAIAKLTGFASAFAAAIRSLTGTTAKAKDLADNFSSAADGAENLSASITEAGKAAKKSLAPFDEITKLSGTDTSSSSGNASSGSANGSVVVDGEVEDELTPKVEGVLRSVVARVTELLEPLREIDFSPIMAAFSNLKTSLDPLTATLFEGLEWAYTNVLAPLAAWTIEDLLPEFLDLLSGSLDVLNAMIEALKPLAKWLWDSFLEPIAKWTGGAIVDVLGGIADGLTAVSDWITNHQGAVQTITGICAAFMAVWAASDLIMWIDAAGGVTAALWSLVPAIVSNTAAKIASKAEDLAIIALYAKDYIMAFGSMITQLASSTASWAANTAAKVASTAAEWAQIAATTTWNAICAVATTVTTAFGAAVAFLTSPIGLVVLAIGALIAIVVLLVKNWDTVKEVAGKVWDGIKSVWNTVANWFKEHVTEPIANFFKNMVNGIIGFINGMISTVVSGINFIIRALNKLSFDVPDWVPLIGGQTWGFNIPEVKAPQIPYLAKGAVLPPNKPFMAVVGDQTHGTNVEAPLTTIQEAVAIVMEDMIRSNIAGHEATVAVLREILEAVLGIHIGDDVIGQAVARYNAKMAVIRGGA